MVERLSGTFENEKLRGQVAHLNDWLNRFAAMRERESRVVAGWISNELRQRGLDEANTNELSEIVRVYLGAVIWTPGWCRRAAVPKPKKGLHHEGAYPRAFPRPLGDRHRTSTSPASASGSGTNSAGRSARRRSNARG